MRWRPPELDTSKMADGLRNIARAYLERASDEEKNEAIELFRKLDVRGDEKIRFAEFRRRFGSSWLEKDFKKLGSNGDGLLEFPDVLVAFYHRKGVIRINECDGCNRKILGPYFSCVSCSYNYPHTYDLCCRCYRRGRSHHEHPLTDFVHDNELLVKFMRRQQTHQPTGEMKELRNIARLHYRAASKKVQELATDFFDSMDEDGNEKVDLREFLSFMSRKGYSHLANRHFFTELDVAGNGALGFWEVMTLYYVMKSGRPICNSCRVFIPGVFFSCVQCFWTRNSFNLCRDCYANASHCTHTHTGGTDFLDNYTLLQAIKESSLAPRPRDNDYDHPSSSREIVPAPISGKTKTDVAYQALELAIAFLNTVSGIVSTAGTAITKCTIM